MVTTTYQRPATKECFWPKKFLNFMHRFKSAILAKMKNYQNSHIWPPPVAIFLALWVWEGTGAIQGDKYLKW